jgi:hypothetical protein
MSSIKFVFVSSDNNFLMPESYIKEVSDQLNGNVDIKSSYYPNNTLGLPIIYNQELEDSTEDFVALFHADVKLDLLEYIKWLTLTKDLFDVVGLAGCQKFKYCMERLNWFTGSFHAPKSRYGCIIHGEFNNVENWYNKEYDNVPYKEVACLDGLNLTLNRNAINKGLRFDKQFTFSHYDTDLSLNAIINYNLKLGVLVIKTLHNSVGKSIYSKMFADEQKLFNKKWDPIFKGN